MSPPMPCASSPADLARRPSHGSGGSEMRRVPPYRPRLFAMDARPRALDQLQITGWTNLGSFTTYPDGSILLEVTDQGPDTTTYTPADAVRFTPCYRPASAPTASRCGPGRRR